MAVIGVGGRGSHDLGWLLGERDVQVVAVCDVQRARREAAQRTVDAGYGQSGCAAYRDLREMIAARNDLDAVLIATGDRWHATASILALRAGLDVYCEKPSCLTIEEGRAVVEAARRHARVYQTGAQRLSEANHVFAIEMARTGRLGAVHTAYADCRWRGGGRRDWLPADPEPGRDEIDWDAWLGPSPWRPYSAHYLAGGWYNFRDFATDFAMWGAHTVAQALAGLDLPSGGTARLDYAGPDQSMTVHLSSAMKLVLFRCPGSVWDPCAYWHGACGERFEGADGWVSAADSYSRPDASSPRLLADFAGVLAAYQSRSGRPMSHLRDFLDCVRTRRAAVAGPEVMLRSMSICLAADVADELRRPLTLDLATGVFVGDAEANRLRLRAARVPWAI